MLLTTAILLGVTAQAAECKCNECRVSESAAVQRLPTDKYLLTTCQTQNFDVYSYNASWPAAEVAKLVEERRSVIFEHWKGKGTPGNWEPKCIVVLHLSRQSYSAAVGRGSERTLGSSLLNVKQGICRGRRIDLLTDGNNRVTALGHELTHVVISDIFQGQLLPRWLDEGFAILADAHEKQLRHAEDWKQAKAQGTAFSLAGLVGAESYPSPSQFPAFYGGSASLTAFLARRGDSTKLLRFAEAAKDNGYDSALREVYEIEGLVELDRIWRQSEEQAAYSLAQADGP